MTNIYENDKIRAAYAKMYCESEDSDEKEVVNNVGSHKLVDDSNPAVWIGTYGNYNDGNLYGEGEASGWVDLTTFDSAEDFHEWLEQQANGKDVEWMFQDYQCFPESLYGESNIDGVWDYIDFKNRTSLSDEQVDAILDNGTSLEELMKLDDNGQVIIYSGCSSMGDVAQQMVSDGGVEVFPDHMYQSAFDYEGFGRDIDAEWDESAYDGKSAYETFGVGEDDDRALGEEYVNQVCGDISELGKDTIMNYVDWDELGDALTYDSTWIECGKDMIEITR